jgi:hypothetical protein
MAFDAAAPLIFISGMRSLLRFNPAFLRGRNPGTFYPDFRLCEVAFLL